MQLEPSTWLAPDEMATLRAVCETLIPAVTASPGDEDAPDFYARTADDLGVAGAIVRALALESPEIQADVRRLLRTLETRYAGAMLAGRWGGFSRLAPEARERALQRMSVSPLAPLRQGFQALKRLCAFAFYAGVDEAGTNPNWAAIGYSPERPDAPVRSHLRLAVPDDGLSAEVVVIGSGAGGGVVAAELAAAGHEVLVLEQGEYADGADFTGLEGDLTPRLFLRRGLLSTRDLGVTVLAGSCVGGGTVVNWSTSLRTPPAVLAEWAQSYGFTGATSAEYARGFDLVEQRLGVNTDDSKPNRNNAALLRGCEALGYRWSPIPRNASGCIQRCGPCAFGCAYGCKQSTLRTFLADACMAGARIVPRCTVRRVLVQGGQVAGVEALVQEAGVEALVQEAGGATCPVTIRARTIVVAAGAVESPALLLRSGLDNPNIGRHLYLHPVAAVAAEYAEPIESWRGSHQTVVCRELESLHGRYGVLIEVAPVHPGLIAAVLPWEGGREHKAMMQRAAFHAFFIAINRDSGEGQVTLDCRGDAQLHYWPDTAGRQRLVRGMQEMSRIALAGGAVEVSTAHNPRVTLSAERRTPGMVSAAQLQRYLAQIERRGIERNRVPLFSAHQMGTCRLGGSPGYAVADPEGEVYGVRGLFVADASGFPTPSGVNPMISTMALAHHVAGCIAARATSQ